MQHKAITEAEVQEVRRIRLFCLSFCSAVWINLNSRLRSFLASWLPVPFRGTNSVTQNVILNLVFAFFVFRPLHSVLL